MTTKQIKELGDAWEERFWKAAVIRSELTGHESIVAGSHPSQAEEFIAQLPERTREILRLRFECGTVPDIGRQMNLSHSRVEKIIQKAILGLMWHLYHAN
jgi:DNA-directed RNA polymerase specialized sigma subunit